MSVSISNSMKGINSYGKELSKDDIDNKNYRDFVGGLWEELGKLQFDFLVANGLKPSHKTLDIGCGCLRGGLHYIDYLDTGNYFGLDVNSSLIEAGRREVKEARLEGKQPTLLVDDQFNLAKFDEKFDFMISVSVFTHLPINMIVRCLNEVAKHLKPKGVYYSTFFQAPKSVYINELEHQPGGIMTHYDKDPFHYSFEEMMWMAAITNLEVKLIGDWGHPRDQKMVVFTGR